VAGLFSENTLEQIRAASDIVDVIGSYLPLKRAGANFVALCPFHKEKSPSFNVNASRQIFHCFGCHKGGDVFTFVKEFENISFVEAVKRLADRAKIPLEMEKDGAGAETRHLKDTLLQIHEQITQRWQNALATDAAGQIARDYLAKRGVSAEAVKLFRLGYAPDAWDDTVNWAKSKGFEIADVEKAGLVIRKASAADSTTAPASTAQTPDARPQTRDFYDRFRGRLMFPICDEQGRVIGFSGRVLAGDEKTAKYVNSPETPIFTKSRVFFGLDKSKRAILDAGHAIVCEGQLDLIACFMGGVQNIVAPQGTAFTSEHARIIKRYVNEVVLCFDSDNAGQNAAVRSLDALLASGLAVRVAVVPAPHDPDSFIKEQGGEAFGQLVKQASGFFDYYLDRLCSQNDIATDRGRQAVLRGMAEALHKTGNAVTLDAFAQKTALRLGVVPEAVRAEFKKLGQPKSGYQTSSEPEDEEDGTPVEVAVKPALLESFLLRLLLAHEEFVPWAMEHLAPEWVEHATARSIVEARFQAASGGNWRGVAALLDGIESPAAKLLITEFATTGKPIPNPATQIADVATRLRNAHIESHRASLRQQISDPALDDAARTALLREDHELRVLKQMPIPPPGAG
jgi:DNA primase